MFVFIHLPPVQHQYTEKGINQKSTIWEEGHAVTQLVCVVVRVLNCHGTALPSPPDGVIVPYPIPV